MISLFLGDFCRFVRCGNKSVEFVVMNEDQRYP